MSNKSMTLRLTEDQAESLDAVARVEGVPVAEVVRTAIEAHISARRQDVAFQQRLRASIERHREILEKLAQ